MKIRHWAVLLLTAQLAGCFSPTWTEPKDGAPNHFVDVSKIPDAVPRVEPITQAGNRSPYTVLGKTYQVMPVSAGYQQQGIASWYGTKFHGRKTSNGETYSMYGMTAAHKTLPIPSYVRVNNLENGRSVIVRVNDRGPFHDDRIIDLSYAAAKKLGFADKGTARVEVIVINPADYQRNSVEAPNIASEKASSGGSPYLQAGAFSSEHAANNLAAKLRLMTEHPVQVRTASDGATLFKVLIGPFLDSGQLTQIRHLLTLERLSPFVVYH